jgi:hypothetical protein
LLAGNWLLRWWLGSQGLLVKGTFTIFLAPSVWTRTAVVAANDLGFAVAIILGIASTKSRTWAVIAIISAIAELTYYALTINRTQGLVFVGLLLGARHLSRAKPRGIVSARTIILILPVLAAVLYMGQAVRNALLKDLRAFLDQDVPRMQSLVWESMVNPELPTGDEKFYANRLNPYDMLGSVVHAVDEEGMTPLYGRTFTTYLPQMIPRLLWPGKPDLSNDAEGSIQEALSLPLVDTMITPVSELYANFKLAGVLIGYALLGAWYGFIYRVIFVRRTAYDEWHILIYLLLLSPLCWMENTFSNAYVPEYREFAITLGVLWILVALSRRFERLSHRRASGASGPITSLSQ